MATTWSSFNNKIVKLFVVTDYTC